MANTLQGAVSFDVIAKSMVESIDRQIAALVERGYSREDACRIVADSINGWAWIWQLRRPRLEIGKPHVWPTTRAADFT